MSAERLKEKGVLTPIRPEIPVPNIELPYAFPNLETAPRGPLDALLILGIHPIEPVLDGPSGKRKVVMTHPMMKNNARAALELVDKNYVRRGGILIPSGTASAYPEKVEEAFKFRQHISREEVREPNQFLHFPASREEADLVKSITEARLLEDFLKTQGAQVLNDMELIVVPDHLATEVIFNFINALNKLDSSVAKNGELFTGSIGIVTTRNHIVRGMQTAEIFNIADQVVPLASQEVLNYFGEKPEEVDDNLPDKPLWSEQKWIRALHQMPLHVLPVLTRIENDKRLINILKHMQTIYPKDVLENFGLGLDNIFLQNADNLRTVLESIKRHDPEQQEWMEADTEAITKILDTHKAFTKDWLSQNVPGIYLPEVVRT